MTHIGEFASKDDCMRAAIRKLAVEIQRCPEAEMYHIVWISPDPDENQRVDRRAVLYERGRKEIGYEHDVFSGISGKAYTVDDAAIQAVAERGGTLYDFSAYEQRNK
ncbi:MAG TPA: hypothetical protein VNN73_01910 [Blastocatellia bacterium]|nr:hypothetical protein [Blastocatellia bacterium]